MNNSDPIELLATAIKEERSFVLFAGQHFDPAHEAVLSAFRAHLKCSDSDPGWRSVLDGGVRPSDMQWLSERFDRSVPSDAITPLFEFAWSAVFTSSLDPQFLRRFETRGRQPEAVLSHDAHPAVPRSRSRPPIHYLLGKSDETAEDVRPPRNLVELLRRVQLQAVALANRIAETATPLGIVVIAGYVPAEDWLSPETLLAPLSDDGQPKVIWFGHSGETDSPLAQDMVGKGSLLTSKATLASAVKELEIRGLFDAEISVGPDEPGMVSLEDGRSLDIGPALRMRVEASAAIVDDGWTENPEPLTDAESYESFRRFHGNRGGFRHLVEGVARGFAVERDFELILWDAVKAKLKQIGKADAEDVVFLHGQSGTGKSIALARLTLRIRKEMRLPVIAAQYRIPHHADIEAFCEEAERLGAPATVLICGFNQSPQRYDGLAAALRSRGRRLLIVGACYRVETHDRDGSHRFVAAPATVSESERSAFEKLRFGVLPTSRRNERLTAEHTFAMFYRRLPAAREGLAAGVSSEARVAEERLRYRAQRMPRPSKELPPIAQQLIDLGIARSQSSWFGSDEKLAALHSDEAGRLIDYVMVTGRIDCPIPVNLLFRVLNQEAGVQFREIVHLFEDIDLFRWQKNEEGSDYLISPRLQLEADLICRRRLSGAQEVGRLLDLIGRVRVGSGNRFDLEGRAEKSFLIDLLFKVDRDGPRREAYREGWARFADALKGLRRASEALDLDLILRESVFRRRAAAQLRGSGVAGAKQKRVAMLDEARDAVDKALDQVAGQQLIISQRTKRRLFGERSAIYGYLAVECALDKSETAYWSDYLAARAAGEKAIGIGGDYHPIDIALWTAGDVLEARKEDLSVKQRGELLADLYSTIDMADDVLQVSRRSKKTTRKSLDLRLLGEGSAAGQRSRYLGRLHEVAAIMGNAELESEAFTELDRVAPEAATFLQARRLAEPFYEAEQPLSLRVREAAKDAADYIATRTEEGVPLDDRCRRLFLSLRWAHATGDRLLFAQRGRTPMQRDTVQELRNVVSDLNCQAEMHARNRERFLEAVLCWILGDMSEAYGIWRSLSQETQYEDRSRVVRWLIASNEDGNPREFRGRVERKGESDWRVRVEEPASLIAIRAHDFPGEDLAHGRTVRGFGIAFNYIGPIADPLSRGVRRR
ncbi:MAG: hypothetical protein OXP11_05895 [Gammaproteobacteria bacterium]|nr:hypothetical protein [Gammaproteobacteria bacterium]